MNPLVQQFILEARDFLQNIGEKLLELESNPHSVELMAELFRLVHTLKGNSGLIEAPEMSRVLHAAEDLLDAVRDGRVAYSQLLADRLLDAADFVGVLLDEIEANGAIDARRAGPAAELAQSLRALIMAEAEGDKTSGAARAEAPTVDPANRSAAEIGQILAAIPETVRIYAYRASAAGAPLFWVDYRPEEECFFKGEDPFHVVRQVPHTIWSRVVPRAPWPRLSDFDCFRCQLDFHLLAAAGRDELDDIFRYTPEQVRIWPVAPLSLVVPEGHPSDGPVRGDFVAEALGLLEAGDLDGLKGAARALLELSGPELWIASALRWLLVILEVTPDERGVLRQLIESFNTCTPPDWIGELTAVEPSAKSIAAALPTTSLREVCLSAEDRNRLDAILEVQAEILALPDTADWLPGRLRAVAGTLSACRAVLGKSTDEVAEALARALADRSSRPLRQWLAAYRDGLASKRSDTEKTSEAFADPIPVGPSSPTVGHHAAPASDDSGFGRRADDTPTAKVLKVDQAKVDRLMELIGEMVVAKNSLPYLANRAENQYGVRELAREIKAQYAVINRIAEEMQDAIMQVRMLPVSFVFQRFPRLVRDVSRKLGKEVDLFLEGEDTEADKNIIEALADPLIHIIRNSLDHGLEPPQVRETLGKPRAGRLLIRAAQESDRVVIEVSDDGRGIDPALIKRKAYEKGIIDEDTLERITDQEAIQLVFVPGFSTAEVVSDLSGRGVGMDVVRSAVEKVGGTVQLMSEVGRGTTLRLSLPLSMAVTNVIVIESDRQVFGVPMEDVIETVRVPRADIRMIKHQKTTVLRGRIVPLMALNDLLAMAAEPLTNGDDEFAALVVRVAGEPVGLLVDGFREVVDVILKPLPGDLARLSCYAGTALLGDGSVLMVLNPKELFQ